MRVGISLVQKAKSDPSPSTKGITFSMKSGRPSNMTFGRTLEITVIGTLIALRLK